MNQDKDASTDKEVSSYMMELYHQRHKILGSGPGLATTVSAMPSIPGTVTESGKRGREEGERDIEG